MVRVRYDWGLYFLASRNRYGRGFDDNNIDPALYTHSSVLVDGDESYS